MALMAEETLESSLSFSDLGESLSGTGVSVMYHHDNVLQTTESLIAVVLLSRVRPFATPGTVAHQAALSLGFPRQDYWSGLPLPSLKS